MWTGGDVPHVFSGRGRDLSSFDDDRPLNWINHLAGMIKFQFDFFDVFVEDRPQIFNKFDHKND